MIWWKKWKRFSSLDVWSFPFMTSVLSRTTKDYLQHQVRKECINIELMIWWKKWKRFSSLYLCSFQFMTSVLSRTTEDYLQHQAREEWINTELMNWWKMRSTFLHCWFPGIQVWPQWTFWKMDITCSIKWK